MSLSVFRNSLFNQKSQAYNDWAGQNDVDNPYYLV
jgi:hypothetical protein